MDMGLDVGIFEKSIPYQIGNVVEYSKNGVNGFGKIEEIRGRFMFSTKENYVEIHYRVGTELVTPNNMIRKVSLQ